MEKVTWQQHLTSTHACKSEHAHIHTCSLGKQSVHREMPSWVFLMGLLLVKSGWKIRMSESHLAHRYVCLNFWKMTGASCYSLQYWWVQQKTTRNSIDLQEVKMQLVRHRDGTGCRMVCPVSEEEGGPNTTVLRRTLSGQTRERRDCRNQGEERGTLLSRFLNCRK